MFKAPLRTFALLLITFFLALIVSSVTGQAPHCDQARSNFWLEKFCSPLGGSDCADHLDTCEYHNCDQPPCHGYIYNCVAPAYACVFDGCWDCPCGL
jgi:hypothetical protein